MLPRSLAAALAVLVACGPGPTPATPIVARPLPPPAEAPLSCPAPPALTRASQVGHPPNHTPCRAGCPDSYACQCDAAGRITFVEQVIGGVPRDRHWFTYDPQGALVATQLDRDADHRLDARSVLASSGACTIESRDTDFDGAIETTCRYDHPCLVGLDACKPVACEPATIPTLGHPCAPADCPRGASCACDDRARIVEVLYNDDADPAYERRTTRSYRGDTALVVEERTVANLAVGRQTFTYDDAGRLLTRRLDAGAPPTVEEDVWAWSTEPGWVGYERRSGGATAERRTRTYRAGKVLTEQTMATGARPVTLRFFPDADPAIVQPIDLSSPLLASPRDLACRRDADCVVIPAANCCPCSGGGAGLVVAKQSRAAVARRLAQACREPRPCPTVISDDASCRPDPTPACVDQLCTLRR